MAITIERFKKTDLKQLMNWGFHTDVRFEHYDFKYFTKADYNAWYRNKQRIFTRWLYAVSNDRELIGFITMKEIKWFKKHATLGVVFNPDRLSRGYGTEAIAKFLELFFKTYQFNLLKLQVADFNKRAIRSYQKNGFRIVKSQIEPFEGQTSAFDILLEEDEHFHMKNGVLMTLVHEMHIEKDIYLKNEQ